MQARATALGLLQELRPKQWYKQSLLFVGIVFSGNLFHPGHFREVAVAVVAFCAAAGAVYIFNDIVDREADRNHPTKRHRPIASRQVSVPAASAFGLTLVGTGVWLSMALDYAFFVIIALYLSQNVVYSLFLKRVPLLDVVVVATGFLLRAIGGVVVIQATISPWLVLCTFLLALLMALGKRHHELATVDQTSRDVLETYSRPLLERVMTAVGIALLTSYGLYSVLGRTPMLVVSLPFVCLGVIRFFRLMSLRGRAPLPPSLLKDARFFVYVTGWVISIVAVIYFVQGGSG